MAASRVPAGIGALRRYFPVSSPLASGKYGSIPIPATRAAGINPASGERKISEYSSWQDTNPFRPCILAVQCASVTRQAGKLEQPM